MSWRKANARTMVDADLGRLNYLRILFSSDGMPFLSPNY